MIVGVYCQIRGSLSVIRRSVIPFGSPERLPTRSVLMSNPTPTSRLSALLCPPQNNVYPAPTSQISPISARRVSLRTAVSVLYLARSLPTRAVLRCGLSDPALSFSVRKIQARLSKALFFASCSTA